jgi:integrase
MPQMAFTKLAVDKIRAPSKEKGQVQYFERLKKGLTLVLSVSYGETKTWRALFYVGGKPRSRRLGIYSHMSVAQAREAAFKFDPDAAVASTEAGTFKEIAESWVREYVDEKKLRSKYEIERHLNVYVYPVWEKKLLFDIRRIDVNNLLDLIKNKHGRNQADAVLRTISSVMSWQAVKDDRYNSPIVKGMDRDKRTLPERSRNRILHDDEIRALWQAASDMGVFGALVKMLLLTGQRLRKVAHMQWQHIEDDCWTIETEPREKGNAGRLVLPTLAIEVLKQLPRIRGNPFVFPASVGNGPFNSFSQRKQELDDKLDKNMPDWVLHDLRRSSRSLMSRAGVRPDIAERVLGHKLQGVEGVYDRYAYLDEKADALARIARLIENIINPASDNVVPIRRS